nr:hypothetical protein [Tanacetum cinerariifolium]
MNSIKDDAILGRLKFVSKGDDNKVYEMPIPDLINDDIKNSKAYQTYLAISTRVVILNKARKGIKTPATPKKNVTKKPTSDEFDDEQEDRLTRRRPTAHDDEYVHDDDEKHDDANEEMNDDEVKDDQVMDDAEKVDSEKIEEKKGDIKQAEDDQVGALVFMTQKEKPEVPPSSSSRSLSSNYVIPPQSTPRPTFTIPTPLTTPLPTLPISSEAPSVTISVPDPLPAFLQILSNLESKFEAWTKVDHLEAIEESVQANIINEVKNQLPKFLPKETGSSSKGKTYSKPSSTDKLVNAEEPLHEAEMDVKELSLDDVANEAD